MKRHALFLPVVFACLPALANGIMHGVATQCDSKHKTFVVAPVIESDVNNLAAIAVQPGFTRLTVGNHYLRCRIDDTTVSAEIRVFPPSNKYHMESGFVDIQSLKIDDKAVIDHREPFNWSASALRLVRLTVDLQKPSHPQVVRCTAKDWNREAGFHGVRCRPQTVSGNTAAQPRL